MASRDHLRATVLTLATLVAACSSDSAAGRIGTGGSGSLGSGGSSGGATGSGGASTVAGSGGRVSSGGTSGGGGQGLGGSSAIGTGGKTGSGGTTSTVDTGGSIGRDGGLSGRDGGFSGRDFGVPGRDAPQGNGGGAGGSGGAGGNGSGVDGGAVSSGGGGASAGCGSANTTSSCSKSGTTCSLDVAGTARTYYVQLPSNYSSSKQYPLVFQFHPMGGSAEQALTMYRISAGLPEAIYVTPQGLSSGGSTGWPNTNGQDIAFTKAMLADVQAKYCVDNARIFSMGFSYGGMMSFAVGCEMGDVFRAIAPMSGALYSDFNCKGTGHAIAMWGSHGLSDQVVPIDDGRAARDKILKQNHCGTETTPIDPSPCVSFQGCDAGYPVTWCEWDGQHGIPSFGSSAIAAFFKQF